MISIIISSYQPKFYDALEKNIAETVGVPYELIKIENPGLMGIAEAYNKGAKKAKFENLLFLHEDVLFHTQNWGEKLIKHLADPKTGITGVAGSDYVPKVPCGWFIKDQSRNYFYIIQNTKSGKDPVFLNTVTKFRTPVFGIDGVFLAMKKEIFQELGFNEKLKGFHGYDLDISLNSANQYKNYVISDILIEHFSLGGADANCFDANILVRRRFSGQYQTKISPEIELERFENFVYSYFRFHGISFANALKTLEFLPIGKIDKRNYYRILLSYFRYFKHRKYFSKKFN